MHPYRVIQGESNLDRKARLESWERQVLERKGERRRAVINRLNGEA